MAERRKRTAWYVGPKLDVPREELAKLDASGEFVIEEKHDGMWAVVHVENGVIVSMESRVGLGFGEVGFVGEKVFAGSISGRFAAELVADMVDGQRIGTRRLWFFDVMELTLNDKSVVDLRDFTLVQRRGLLQVTLSAVIGSFEDRVLLVKQRPTRFVEFYDEVVGLAGEGVVVKRVDPPYRPMGSDGKTTEWVRCKPRRTVDYVVMEWGFAEKGTPQAQLGLFKDGELTKVMKATVPNELLDTAVPGAVVELIGHELLKSGSLRFGHVQRVRDDKLAEDCTLEAARDAERVMV